MITYNMEINFKSIYLLFIVIAIVCCKPRPVTFLKAKDDEVKLEVDSICRPEAGDFPIQLRLTNYSNKKVLLIFDFLPSGPGKYATNNLYLTTPIDTFILGVRTLKYLVFKERTITTFLCEGYYHQGKGSFDSFRDIDPAFKNGKLIYSFEGKIPHDISQEELLSKADTVLVPYQLEVHTNNAVIVSRISSSAFWIKEEPIRR